MLPLITKLLFAFSPLRLEAKRENMVAKLTSAGPVCRLQPFTTNGSPLQKEDFCKHIEVSNAQRLYCVFVFEPAADSPESGTRSSH
jgi:hypothetical protein